MEILRFPKKNDVVMTPKKNDPKKELRSSSKISLHVIFYFLIETSLGHAPPTSTLFRKNIQISPVETIHSSLERYWKENKKCH